MKIATYNKWYKCQEGQMPEDFVDFNGNPLKKVLITKKDENIHLLEINDNSNNVNWNGIITWMLPQPFGLGDNTDIDGIENNLFICSCFSPEHQLIFSYDKSDILDDGWVYAAVHLTPFGFWKRLWHGLRYIFGHRSIYGDFDEFIFKTEDADKLQRVVDYLNKIKGKQNH